MNKLLTLLLFIALYSLTYSQSWQDVGGGLNNSTHCLTTWDGKLVVGGSFNNNPCDRIALWDGTQYECLGGGVGIVARAACVWEGKLVVVGDFWNNFQPCVGCNGVAVWDGVSWTPLDNGVNNDVLTCTVWNNELVIGGDFTQANGVPIARIAKWNGSSWESVGPIGVFDNDIRCMTEFEGELWVGGDFNNVGGCSPCDGVVKYDPSTGGWAGGNSGVDLVGGVNESVRVLYVNPTDGNLYMGGEFPELIDGDAGVVDYNMSGIAMYDGSNWTPLGTGLNEYCRAIHEYNGNVIAGGYFTTAGGVPANKIAKWDGTNWSAMGQGFDGAGVDEYVKAATEWNGIFFAGGAYTQAEGGPMNYIAQWYEAPTNPPTAWMTYSSTTLCGSGCIDFLDNSTNSPTSWSWTFPGSDVPTSTDENPGTVCWSSPGTYTVTLQACNSFGCNTQSIDIEVSNGATVTVNDESICTGGNATLVANPSIPGGSFSWSPGGETTQSITVSPGADATYSVTYTLPGCVSAPAVSTVTVVSGYNVNENVEACQNSSITYPDGTSETITSNTSHSSLLVSSGGCDSTVVTNVTMVTAYNSNENYAVCQNSTVTYPDGTTETITVNTTHTSNLISSTGCDSIIVTNVTMTTPYNLSENISVCENTSVTYPDGTSETITGNTSHTSNLISSVGCDSTIVTTVTMNQSYNLTENVNTCENTTITYPDGTTEVITSNTTHTSSLVSTTGCDSTVVTSVTMNQNYTTTQNEEICSGSSYTYPDGTVHTNITLNESHTSALNTAFGCDSVITTNLSVVSSINTTDNVSVCSGDNYTYPDGTVSNNISVGETHTSNLISVYGCDSIITTNISVNPLPTLTSTSGTICDGESITLSATASLGGGSYLWSPGGETTQTITVSPASSSNYTVTYTKGGCESNMSTSSVTVNPMPNNGVTQSNNVITATETGAIYQWIDCNDNNSHITGETSQSYTPSTNGNYAVIIDLGGCSDTSACTLISTIGFNELAGQDIQLFPNPVVDDIYIKGLNGESYDFEITDAQGKLIMSNEGFTTDQIHVSQLAKGVYLLKLNDGNSGIYRFVKQ